MKSDQHNTILIVGASRGLGHAMAATFLQHGWEVIGTVRDLSSHTPLHDLAKTHPLRLRLATLDIRDEAQLAALQATLPPASLDMLFVNAGTTNRDPSQTIGDVSTEEFYQVMLTNALAPMRVIERLQQAVKPQGLLGVMSSGQGSLTNNLTGQRELYRGSKAALNMFMRSFAARPSSASHPLVVMARDGSAPSSAGRCPADHRRDDPTPGEHPTRQTATSGTGVSRLPGPYRALVIRAGTTIIWPPGS
ncbi:short-chain dehydrogenase/reductase SDR [Klebsiella pneumoniae subsp. pneumoniae]|uniref:Short-chain dehydrogenase/reductase SDR n=1 Tax=Klebsiella pneumoniae subsp. pneumoniae TaxID=72407 RepID=A0A377ZVR1_KLEPN|nr:short-chain dehydrogenase/reductase SDR [Klebsiella pneumoniae subsp. pneumoniae]